MAGSTNHSAVDVSLIQDPDVRRALRQIQEEYANQLAHQRAEIDAILEVLLEKHLTSVGELRRHVAKSQQAGTGRAGRLHDALWGNAQSTGHGTHPTPH